jgi:hypothetical protein
VHSNAEPKLLCINITCQTFVNNVFSFGIKVQVFFNANFGVLYLVTKIKENQNPNPFLKKERKKERNQNQTKINSFKILRILKQRFLLELRNY